MVKRVLAHVDKLEHHPRLGAVPEELEGLRYRQVVAPPCRIFYRAHGEDVLIPHVMRNERLLRMEDLEQDDQKER